MVVTSNGRRFILPYLVIRAKNNPAAQSLVAVSVVKQIEKIKKEARRLLV